MNKRRVAVQAALANAANSTSKSTSIPSMPSGDLDSIEEAKIDADLNFSKLTDSLSKAGISFRDYLSAQGSEFSVSITETKNGGIAIKLPGDKEETIFEMAVFETNEEIEQNTYVDELENDREQQSITELLEIRTLISAFGQIIPAVGVKKSATGKISVIDGSRRRAGCLESEKPFKVLYAEKELSREQIDALKEIFSSQKELSFYEICRAYWIGYNDFMKKELEENGKPSSAAQYHKLKGISESKGHRMLTFGEIEPFVIGVFPDKKALTQSIFINHLGPFVKSVVGVLGQESAASECLNLLSHEISKFDELDEHEMPDDYHAQAITNAHNTFNQSNGTPSSSPVQSQKNKPEPKYLLGKKGDKNFLHAVDNGKSIKVTGKFTSREQYEQYLELMKSFTKEDN